MAAFRDDLEDDVTELIKTQRDIAEKIGEKLYNKDKSDGLLFHSKEEYLSCLGKVNLRQLMTMLDKDLMNWGSIAKGTEHNQHKFTSKIEAFLKDQKQQLARILKPTDFSYTPSAHIQKLPILSSKFSQGASDFSWPSEAEMKATSLRE